MWTTFLSGWNKTQPTPSPSDPFTTYKVHPPLAPPKGPLHSICNAEDLATAQTKLAAMIEKYSGSAPQLAAWMENNLPEGFTFFAFPEPIRQRLRTTNLCEALNKQIRRRTRVAAIFPNPESCLRPVSVILMEISETWETSTAYPGPELLK